MLEPEELDFGGQSFSREQFVNICQNGNPWKEVKMLAATYDEHGGAILYEGTDTVTGKTIRVGEFIQIKDGKVSASIASFGSGQPPL